jgi:LysR family hydrogen peroxide-inducible transcriptional activator
MIQTTLRQLEYAVAVADHLHFRRAAEACHVSQPALSNQIAELEHRLGCQLFDRSAGGVVVTPAGQELLLRARRVLEEAASLEHTAHHFSRPFSGTLRLGIIPTMAPYLLPHVIPTLSEEYPDFDLVVHEEQTENLLGRLKRGEAELLFLALPIETDGILCETLFHEDFVLAVPDAHPLGRLESARVADLRSEPVLLLDDGHCFRDHALEVCQMAGAVERTDVRAAHLGTLVELVRAGLGVTLLPQSSLPILQPRLDAVRILHFEDPAPSRQLGLAWRRASGSSREYQAIGDTFRRAFTQVPGLRPAPSPERAA